MVDLNMDLEGEEKRDTSYHRGLMIFAGIVIVGILALAIWRISRQPEMEAKQGAMAQMKRELDGQRAQVMMVKDKILDLTNQLGEIKNAMDSGAINNKAKAIEQYNLIAAQQRETRELYQKLTNEYNTKLAEYRSKGGE